MVSRGRTIYAAKLPGFCAVSPREERVGLATYEVAGDECQLVTLHAFVPFAGIGTRLIEAVRKAALDGGCRRLWLVTTNDNLDALRFYQRRGFSLVAVHRGLRDVDAGLSGGHADNIPGLDQVLGGGQFGPHGDRPSLIANPKLSNPTIDEWFNTDAFVINPLGLNGNERRNPLYGPHNQHWDLSVAKDFRIREGMKMQFRAESFNLTNTASFGLPGTNMPGGGGPPGPAFGSIASTAIGSTPRRP